MHCVGRYAWLGRPTLPCIIVVKEWLLYTLFVENSQRNAHGVPGPSIFIKPDLLASIPEQ